MLTYSYRPAVRTFATALLLCSGPHVFAGTVTEARLTGQPLQYMEGGTITGCGVRIVGIPNPVPGTGAVKIFDVSFNVVNPAGGLVKGGLTAVPMQAFLAQDLARGTEVPIKNVWLKAPGSPATTPLAGGPLAAQTHKHALMYVTSLESVLSLVTAVQEGQQVQIGFRVKKEDLDSVFFGRVLLSESEAAQFAQCFLEWSDALRHRMESFRTEAEPASATTK